jgi:hypothetical protein
LRSDSTRWKLVWTRIEALVEGQGMDLAHQLVWRRDTNFSDHRAEDEEPVTASAMARMRTAPGHHAVPTDVAVTKLK